MIKPLESSFPVASLGVRALCILLHTICLLLLAGCVLQIQLNHSVLVGPFLIGRITVSLAAMVALVGTIVLKFSMRYMAFDSGHDRFCGWVFMTAISGICLMLSDHLLLLFFSWGAMSLSLHQLLVHYRDNQVAQSAAWKKFRFSRISDCALLAAIVIIFRSTHSWSLSQFLTNMNELSVVSKMSVAWFIAIAAMAKSAQFPFHRWLPETLDSPTPVSAIMHAGAINGGGALLMKFAPAIIQAPSACLALSVIGCLTMVVGMRGLWREPTLKGKLAWSTVAQMGFMTAECGVAAFAAAFLHIIAHGLYKAEGFLRSGTLPSKPTSLQAQEGNRIGWIGLCAISCVPVFWIAAEIFHVPFQSPSQIGIALMLSLSVGQAVVTVPLRSKGLLPLSAMFIASLAMVVYAVVESFLAGLIPLETTPTIVSWIAALLPGVTLAGLSFEHESSRNANELRECASIRLDRAVVNPVKELSNAK